MREAMGNMDALAEEMLQKSENEAGKAQGEAINEVAAAKKVRQVKMKLKQPLEFGGKKYTEFAFDFAGLKGKDLINIDAEMILLGNVAVSPQVSRDFQARLAARAAGVASEVMLELSIVDFSMITNRVQNFLMGMGF